MPGDHGLIRSARRRLADCHALLRRAQRWEVARRRARRAVRTWLHAGRPAPPPEPVKRKLVRATADARGLRVFVESGTFRGDMVEVMRRQCRQVVSIELDPARHRAAVARFAGRPGVTLLEGDSGELLPGVLATLTEPALFWLDGHYSGPGTARGETETPILAELSHVLGHEVFGHTILVDDARLFDGTDDYPTLAEVEQLVREMRPAATIVVRDDMVEISL